MAESADRLNPTERYGEIEKAYCADQWGEVIDQGQSLLQEIRRSSAPVPEGLKERVQLLMAHAHLYGFNERDVAENFYSDVLHSKAELALRQIAEQGLQQCSLPPQATPAVMQAGEAGETPLASAAGAVAATSSAQASTEPQAPASRQASTITTRESEARAQELVAATDSARTGMLDSEPAMAPVSASSAPTSPAAASPAIDLPTGVDPASASSTTAAPAAAGSLAMPWLEAGAVTTNAAAAPSSSAPTPWATAAIPLAPQETTPPPEAQADALEPLPPQPGAAASEAAAPVVAPGDEDVTLIPEVVEEPELFEVHQADPSLAEELELTELEPPAAILPPAAASTALPSTLPAVAASTEILRAEAEAGPSGAAEPPTPPAWQEEPLDINQKLTPESLQQDLEPETQSGPQSLLSLTKEAPDLAAAPDGFCELFRNPPAPVGEEDPELLLGLLRVVVSAASAGDGG